MRYHAFVPVYLFTYHAYRSWMPDHKRGFTKEGGGYQAPNAALANAYHNAAASPPFEFDPATQRFLIEVVLILYSRNSGDLIQ